MKDRNKWFSESSGKPLPLVSPSKSTKPHETNARPAELGRGIYHRPHSIGQVTSHEQLHYEFKIQEVVPSPTLFNKSNKTEWKGSPKAGPKAEPVISLHLKKCSRPTGRSVRGEAELPERSRRTPTGTTVKGPVAWQQVCLYWRDTNIKLSDSNTTKRLKNMI